MKTYKYVIVAATFFLLISLFSFTYSESSPLPTKLRVTVLDGLGNIVEKATVTIYDNEESYRNNENPVDMGMTDSKGRVVFKELQPMVYFVDVRKGDMNNNGEGVQTQTLQEGRVNTINIVIE